MGLVAQEFDHIKDNKEITELSVVLYADSFFCGYWNDKAELLKTSVVPAKEFKHHLSDWRDSYSINLIKLLSTGMPYIHIPQEHFRQKYYDKYFDGVYDIRKCYNRDKELDSFANLPVHTLHYIDNDVLSFLNKEGIAFRVAHISTVMSNYAASEDCDFFIYMHENHLHICCHKEGQFKFYNQFYCADVNDYLYFILMVFQALDYDQASEKVQLTGDIDRTSKLYVRLRTYLPKMSLVDDKLNLEASVTSPMQSYFDLYLAKTCA